MKKWLIGITSSILLILAFGIYYIETEYAGIGLPWTKTVDLPTLPSINSTNIKTNLTQSDQGLIQFSSKSPYDFSELLNNYDNAPASIGQGELFLPKSASITNPVPAMIILHGSGGLREDREYMYAQLFNDMGIAAFVLDYYIPRGVTEKHTYLQKTLTTSETDIIVDAYNALRIIGTHPLINANKIGVTGYSYGGMATRYTLDARIKSILAPDLTGFVAHADFYGPCHQTLGGSQFTNGAYLAVFGDSDNSVNPAQCQVVHQILRDAGVPTQTVMLSGVGHAWENQIERKEYDYPYINNCTMSFAPDTGKPLINGQPVAYAETGASRDRRAYMRARIMMDAPDCIGRGYIIGRDENALNEANKILKVFLGKYLLQ
jgi:dienelactone hydrolase